MDTLNKQIVWQKDLNTTYHDSKDKNVIMVGRRLLQIILLLLRQLWSYAVIKEVKSCNHQSRHNGCKYICRRDRNQILTLNISESIQNYIIFRAVSLKFAPQRSLTFFASKNRKQLTYYLHYGPVSQWTWLPGKWRQQPPGDSWRHLAWQGIWQCCPHNYHKWDTIISYEASKTSCKWQIKLYD